MQVNTTRFGLVELEQERVITFAKGLLGFPDNKDYVLLQTNNEGNFFWLQSVDRLSWRSWYAIRCCLCGLSD